MRRRIHSTNSPTLVVKVEEKPVKTTKSLGKAGKLTLKRDYAKRKPVNYERDFKEIQLQKRIIEHKTDGWSVTEIAEELGLSKIYVANLMAKGLDDYFIDRDLAMRRYLTVAEARLEGLFRTYAPRARGYVERYHDGTEVVHQPDLAAANFCLKVVRDGLKAFGLNRIRIEHTGKDGEAIRAEIDWTKMSDEQIHKFLGAGDTSVLRSYPTPEASSPGDVGATPSEDGEDGGSSSHH